MTSAARAAVVALLVLLPSIGPAAARLSPGAAPPQGPAASAPIGTDVVRVGVLRNGSYEIVRLPLEVYVARVLAGEAAPDTPPAALEALAVAVRTYTIANRGRHGSEGFDLCDQTHCQVMRNSTPATEHAALATSEQILLYRGAPASVFYSASCGGRSEKPSNVWPGADDPVYLPIHDDDGCGGFPMWSAELATPDLQRAFHAGGYTGTLRDIRILSHNDSGRVARLALDGMTPREISGQDLRMVVGRALGFQHLQSTQFELRRAGGAFRFTGRGAGHGVGLCVIGSMKLASRGQTAAAILGRYFPGTQLGSYGPRISPAPPEQPTLAAPAPRTTRAVPVVPQPGTATSAALPSAAAPTIAAATPASAAATAAPPASAASARTAPAADAASVALPSDLMLTATAADMAGRASLAGLIVRERQALAGALGVQPVPVKVRVHDTNDAFERASGQSWFVMGALVRGEIQLAPLSLLGSRGMLERTVRRQLVHALADATLPSKPAWIREGAAVYFADPEPQGGAARQSCPQDSELQRPLSIGAYGDALGRARACFERQLGGGRDWRKVR